MTKDLRGLIINIRISDPWDLGNALGWPELNGEIINTNNKSVIIKLDDPFVYKDVRCEYFITSSRYVDQNFDSFLLKKILTCGFTRIPPAQIDSEKPFDLSWWRGGIAFIGNIQL